VTSPGKPEEKFKEDAAVASQQENKTEADSESI
jgi:hypothetical protein